jgi:SRSO17 transposase
MSVGQGAKGPRVYQWAAGRFGGVIDHPRGALQHWLLVRRDASGPGDSGNPGDRGDRAYYFCAAPLDATPQDLAIAAGQRWAIETCFQTAKQDAGLDEYEVRSWIGWYRHITFWMLALACLAAVRAEVARSHSRGKSDFRID